MLPVLTAHRRHTRRDAAQYAAALGKAFQSHPLPAWTGTKTYAADGCTCPPTNSPLTRVDRDILTWCQTKQAQLDDPGAPSCIGRAACRDPSPFTNSPARASNWSRRALAGLERRRSLTRQYSEILDRIESIDYAIFSQRARTVGKPPHGCRSRAGAGTGPGAHGWTQPVWYRTEKWIGRQYLIESGRTACLITLHRWRLFGPGVYRAGLARRGRRGGRFAAVFVVWDAVAIAAHVSELQPALRPPVSN
jgi:hypothetical protein